MDLANWMRNLPLSVYALPLPWLAIPGSHDSFSYSIPSGAPISPDEKRLQCFDSCFCFSPIIKRVIFQWTLTQSLTCTQQLNQGIRYFDFRLAAGLGTLTPYIVHGMYGSSAIPILQEIRTFLDAHTSEIVLLDFQHFYNFTDEMHEYLLLSVKRIFGNKLCPKGLRPREMTLSHMWGKGFRVLVFYRDSYAEPTKFVLPSKRISNPWPDTANPRKMAEFLEADYLRGHDPNVFFVSQGVLTPGIGHILLHLFSSLKNNLAPKAHYALQKWLSGKRAGKFGLNVVMADFVEMTPYNFSTSVIMLNHRLGDVSKAKLKPEN